MNLRFSAILILTAATQLHAQTPDADFAARCSAPGVVKCYGFDNTTTDVVRNVNLFPDGSGTFRAGVDTVTKASGGGSLRFDLPPPPHAGQNIAGRWSPENVGWGATFSENSTFYIQYRMRLTPYMVGNAYGGAGNVNYKTTVFHYNSQTCASISLVTSNYYGNPIPQFDTDCGSRWMWTTLDGSQYTDTPPMLMQQTAAMTCAYGVNYAQKCETFVANEWMTLYYKIQVGTWGQANSSIDAWIGREGASTLQQWVKMRNFKLYCNGNCATSPDRDAGYNNVTMTPYMTGLSQNVGPTSTEYMWFDEFVVSRQPIAAPGAGAQPRPMPPTNLTSN